MLEPIGWPMWCEFFLLFACSMICVLAIEHLIGKMRKSFLATRSGVAIGGFMASSKVSAKVWRFLVKTPVVELTLKWPFVRIQQEEETLACDEKINGVDEC